MPRFQEKARELEVAFNSLFEMPSGEWVDTVRIYRTTFNSLFEMLREFKKLLRARNAEELSILYLRCIATAIQLVIPREVVFQFSI